MAVNCVRYLGYTSLKQVDRLTISEYNTLMEGVRLREIDKDYRVHQLAFLNLAVKAQKKTGKNKARPVYRKFTDFFDYEAAVNRYGQKKTGSRFSALSRFLKGEEKDAGNE